MSRKAGDTVAMTVTLEPRTAARLSELCAVSGHDPQTMLAVLIEDHFEGDMAEIVEMKRRLEGVDDGRSMAHDDVVLRGRAVIKAASRRKMAG